MNPETIKAIEDALSPLAAKLGQSAAQVFEWAVRRSYFFGLMDILVPVSITLILGVFFWRIYVWYARKWATYETDYAAWSARDDRNYDTQPDRPFHDDSRTSMGLSFWSVIVACLLFSVLVGSSGVDRLLNPEINAVSDIVTMVRGEQ